MRLPPAASVRTRPERPGDRIRVVTPSRTLLPSVSSTEEISGGALLEQISRGQLERCACGSRAFARRPRILPSSARRCSSIPAREGSGEKRPSRRLWCRRLETRKSRTAEATQAPRAARGPPTTRSGRARGATREQDDIPRASRSLARPRVNGGRCERRFKRARITPRTARAYAGPPGAMSARTARWRGRFHGIVRRGQRATPPCRSHSQIAPATDGRPSMAPSSDETPEIGLSSSMQRADRAAARALDPCDLDRAHDFMG